MRDQPWEKHIAENRVNQQVQRVRRVIKKVIFIIFIFLFTYYY